MKIEKEKIRLLPVDLAAIKKSSKIKSRNSEKYFNLNPAQLEILELFNKTYSVYEVVQHFFNKGQLISFIALQALLEFLIEEGLIMNENFQSYFIKKNVIESFFSKIVEKFSGDEEALDLNKHQIKDLPFFRNLNAETMNILVRHANVMEVPAGVTLCQEGMLQRSLFVLLSGQASVFKKDAKGQQRKSYTLSESNVFGEVGFFFGEVRSASVVTDVKSRFVIIKYIPEMYDEMIYLEKSQNLQSRIKLIQALNRSSMFRDLPRECFDALIFSGELKKIPVQTLVCKEGDVGQSCYVIIEGKVSVTKKNKALAHLGPGDCFGEMALVVSKGLRTASVSANTELLVLEISLNRFYQLLSENFLLAYELEKLAHQRLQQQ